MAVKKQEFPDSPALAALFNAGAVNPAHCAHLAMNISSTWGKNVFGDRKCNARVRNACAVTARQLAPAFKQAGIPTIWTWEYNNQPWFRFHVIPPGGAKQWYGTILMPPGDIVMNHKTPDAFSDPALAEHLRDEGIHTLFISGFYSAEMTARSAAEKNIKTVLVEDLTFRISANSGLPKEVIRAPSSQVLHYLGKFRRAL